MISLDLTMSSVKSIASNMQAPFREFVAAASRGQIGPPPVQLAQPENEPALHSRSVAEAANSSVGNGVCSPPERSPLASEVPSNIGVKCDINTHSLHQDLNSNNSSVLDLLSVEDDENGDGKFIDILKKMALGLIVLVTTPIYLVGVIIEAAGELLEAIGENARRAGAAIKKCYRIAMDKLRGVLDTVYLEHHRYHPVDEFNV